MTECNHGLHCWGQDPKTGKVFCYNCYESVGTTPDDDDEATGWHRGSVKRQWHDEESRLESIIG